MEEPEGVRGSATPSGSSIYSNYRSATVYQINIKSRPVWMGRADRCAPEPWQARTVSPDRLRVGQIDGPSPISAARSRSLAIAAWNFRDACIGVRPSMAAISD